ncbi:hypothetical protein DsansV1_C07g0074511 [Dioscorea sansibarensis]
MALWRKVEGTLGLGTPSVRQKDHKGCHHAHRQKDHKGSISLEGSNPSDNSLSVLQVFTFPCYPCMKLSTTCSI